IGIRIDYGASNNVVGGPTAAQRNVISGNSGNGIEIFAFGTNVSGNVIAGNYIGTDVTGTAALPNAGDGVLITNGASRNTVGSSVNPWPCVPAPLLVPEEDQGAILIYDAAPVSFLGTFISAPRLNRPVNIQRGPDGLLYVVSFNNSSVLRFN